MKSSQLIVRILLCFVSLVLWAGAQATGQNSPAGAGGPGNGQGPIIIPRKTPPPPHAGTLGPAQPTKAPSPEYTYHVNVPEVRIPVTVETNDGNFIGNLRRRNFQLWENGKPQKILGLNYTNQAPMTAVLLVEYRNTWWPFLYHILEASYTFTGQLEPKDWVALVTYDIKPHIVVDFTHNKQAIYAGLNSLYFPGFSEGDLYDSLAWTIDRLQGVKGHKIIVLVTTGLNTFSHINFGQIRKKVESARNITIYPVSIGWSIRQWLQENGYMGNMQDMDFIVGNSQLRYFAKWTGGRFYEPRFEGAYPDVFQSIAASVRNQYILSYRPTDTKLDGKFRKIKVKVIGNNGHKLRIVNRKGKKVKYKVIAQSGYRARLAVQ